MLSRAKILAAILAVAASVVAYYRLGEVEQIFRVLIVVGAVIVAAGLMLTTESGQNAWSFIKGANIERQKVVWPTKAEALQVTFMVIILVIILGFMMWVFDAISFYAIYDVVLGVQSS